MATLAQIRQTAAENLGIHGEGETLPDYESDDMGQAYNEVYAGLQDRGLTAWSSTADVPDLYAGPVAMLVAEARAVKYQIPENRYVRLKFEATEALKTIREVRASSKMGVTEIESF